MQVHWSCSKYMLLGKKQRKTIAWWYFVLWPCVYSLWQQKVLNSPLLELFPPRFPFLLRGILTAAPKQTDNTEQEAVDSQQLINNPSRENLPRVSKYCDLCSLAPRFRHHQWKVRLAPTLKYFEFSLSFSIYYLWLSPGNRYLMPGCDGNCFWKCLGQSIVHVAAPDSTIFPLLTACTPGTLLLYGSHNSRELWVM